MRQSSVSSAAAPAADAVAILRAEHDDGDVARIVAEGLLHLRRDRRRAVAHQAVEIVALARDRYAGAGGEGFDEAAEQPFGEPVADDLHLIDVIFGERRDEAAAEPLLLRGGGQRPHEQEGRKGYGEEGANHVDRSLR